MLSHKNLQLQVSQSILKLQFVNWQIMANNDELQAPSVYFRQMEMITDEN